MQHRSTASFPVNFRKVLGEQLYEHSPIHVAIIDRDFNVVQANGPFARKFGQAEGRPCYEVYKRRSTRCKNCQGLLTFEDGKVRTSHEQGFDAHGLPTHFLIQVAPLFDTDGNITHIVEMSYDTTPYFDLKEQYDDLFECVPCSITVIDRDLRIVRSNRQSRDTYGAVDNLHCYELYKNRSEACPYCPVLKTFEDGQPHTSKQSGVTRQGRPNHYVVSSFPLRNGNEDFEYVMEMSIDVTETHELSQELMRESEFRRNITESLNDALVAVDEEGMVKVFNSAAEELFGLRANKIIGRSNYSRFFPEKLRLALVDGGSSIVIDETEIENAEGIRIPVRVSGSVIRDEHGVVIGGAASFQDLREIKRLEQEKLDRERLAAVGQTVAVIAHAIKNILVGIQGGMYKLKSGRKRDSEELIEKGLSMLDRNFGRVAELVRGLLDLSRNQLPKLDPIRPRDIAAEVHQLFKDAAQKKGIDFRFEFSNGENEAYLDHEGIHSCLDNLISNAFDAVTEAKVEHPEVSLGVRETEKEIIFETRDNGPGIPPELRSRLFEMFFTTKGANGSGLGLAVTKKIVQEHGGRIAVECTPENGTLFRISLSKDALNRLWRQRQAQKENASI